MKDVSHNVGKFVDHFLRENARLCSKYEIDKPFMKQFIRDHGIHISETSDELSMHANTKVSRDGKRVTTGTLIGWLIEHKDMERELDEEND